MYSCSAHLIYFEVDLISKTEDECLNMTRSLIELVTRLAAGGRSTLSVSFVFMPFILVMYSFWKKSFQTQFLVHEFLFTRSIDELALALNFYALVYS